MLEGKLENGFEYAISEEALNDYEVLEIISEIDTNASYTVKLAKKLLGKEKHDELKECCRVDGKVKMDLMIKAIGEILQSHQATKNS